MQKQVDVDPLCELPTEDVTIRGVVMHVRGLNIRELRDVTRPCKGDGDAIAEALVTACVTRGDGKDVIPAKMAPSVFKTLSEAVARVNGLDAGNSKATDADASSTA